MDQGLTTMTTLPLIHQVLTSEQQKHFLAIEHLNQQFYEYYASAFHSTRAFGWRGWKALLSLHNCERLRILDIGCGGGRLADFMQRVWVEERGQSISSYIGLERSNGLLDRAKTRTFTMPTSWAYYDWSSTEHSDYRVEHQQDWVTLFGVMHHIYGFEARVHMIESVVKALRVGGVLSISHWNFGADQRYQKKILDWAPLLEVTSDLSALCIEEGDYLLGWAGETHTPRFCHWVSPDEEKRWLEVIAQRIPELSPPIISTVEGDQNRYISWKLLHPFNPT